MVIELHPVENPVENSAGPRPGEEGARLLIARGLRALEQARDELSQVGASRRAPLVEALADFEQVDATMPGLRSCSAIRELLERVLRNPTERHRTRRHRRLRTALDRVTRARALALDLLTNPLIAGSAR